MWLRLFFTLCAFCIGHCSADNPGHIFSSSQKMSRLLDAERDAVCVIRQYISDQRDALAKLKSMQRQILDRHEDDSSAEPMNQDDASVQPMNEDDSTIDKDDASKQPINEDDASEHPINEDDSSEHPMNEDDFATEHPINALHLTYRFTHHWNHTYFIIFNSTDHGAIKKRLRKRIAGLLPKPRDIHGSFKSIAHLQRVYGLRSRDLAAGRIRARRISVPSLDQADCYFMAQAALEYDMCQEALDWLRIATDKIPSEEEYRAKDKDVQDLEAVFEIYGEDASKTHIANYLKIAVRKLDDAVLLKRAMATAHKAIAKSAAEQEKRESDHMARIRNIKFASAGATGLKMNGLELDKIQEIASEAAENMKKDKEHVEEHKKIDSSKLCRGRSARKPDPKLVCSYRVPNVPYNIYKQELINADPMLIMIYNFITDSEIQHLKDLSEQGLKRAATGSKIYYEERVQSSCWHDDANSTTVSRLSVRASEVTGLDCVNWAETWQVGQYGIGGRYGVHLDYDRTRFSYAPVREKSMGDRLATFMLYLSDVEAGGYTVFPRLDVFVRPVKGAAVLWYNYTEEGLGDPRTLHAACPVLLGHKWVANKWIHMYGNELNRPCRAGRNHVKQN